MRTEKLMDIYYRKIKINWKNPNEIINDSTQSERTNEAVEQTLDGSWIMNLAINIRILEAGGE